MSGASFPLAPNTGTTTTEIALTRPSQTRPSQQVKGAGPMDCESRRGAFFHLMIAFDAAGVPLGLVGQKSWTRDEISRASKIEKTVMRRARAGRAEFHRSHGRARR